MEPSAVKYIADYLQEMKSYIDMNSVPEGKRSGNFYTALFASSTKLDATMEQLRLFVNSPPKVPKHFNTDEESFDMDEESDDILPIESETTKHASDTRIAHPKTNVPSEDFKYNDAEYKLIVQKEKKTNSHKIKYQFCIFADNVPIADAAGHTCAASFRNACARIMHRFIYHPNIRSSFDARSKKIVTVGIKDTDKGSERLFVVSK